MGFNRLAVIGIGLIGGSFALAARGRRLVDTVVGVARSQSTLTSALECGAADEVTHDPAAAVAEADLVYIATPVGATDRVMAAIAPALKPDALVTDAGSTKLSVVALAEQHLGGNCVFIGGHPMAGSEQDGVAAARADLFAGRTYFLTPTPDTPGAHLSRLRGLAEGIGATVAIADAAEHDRMVAATSHLPHLVAAALCGSLADLSPTTGDLGAFVGSGVRDATRIAKGSPEMWRDILLDNCEHVTAALEEFSVQVARYVQAMRAGDGVALEDLLSAARELRGGLDRQ